MADSPTSTGASIDALLQERARFQQWLAKLDAAAGTAPLAVREKVRADYEGRLRAVIEELKSHAEAVHDELDRHRTTQADLESQRATAEETLAEASVRHAVGEYSEEDWQRLNEEASHTLEAVQGQLAQVVSEITRLVEVQSLITEAPKPAPVAEPIRASGPALSSSGPRPAPPIEMLPDPTPDVDAAVGAPAPVEPLGEMAQPAAAPSAPRFVPKPAAAAEPPRGRPTPSEMDELAFLKSVSGDDRKSGRRSGEHAAAPERAGAPAATQPSAKPGHASQQKTLKCGECGTLNRATEWYCERCGAELAAL
jgi:hypothetical protein